jgi:DNA-binding transcriptional MerR regulator
MPLVKIGKAAELLGVSVQTLRKWEDPGELVPDRRSEGGVRDYDMGKILGRLKSHCVGRSIALN